MRHGLLSIGVLSGIGALGYFLQWPWMLATWPWPESRLSYVFVSSILAAVAGAMAWVGLSGRLAGAAGGFLHVATMMIGLAIVWLPLAQQRQQNWLMVYALGCAAAAIGCLVAFAWVRRLAVLDTRPIPTALRVWSVLYILILLPAGAALIAVVPGIMPWPVKPEMSMVCGWVFVAAAWSFAYPLLHPQIEHIRVGLVGFLVYDAVLIPPFVQHLDKVRPELQNSLRLYLLALAVTAVVSIYYMFLCPRTRVRA